MMATDFFGAEKLQTWKGRMQLKWRSFKRKVSGLFKEVSWTDTDKFEEMLKDVFKDMEMCEVDEETPDWWRLSEEMQQKWKDENVKEIWEAMDEVGMMSPKSANDKISYVLQRQATKATPRASIEGFNSQLSDDPTFGDKHFHGIGWGCIEGDCGAHVATVSVRSDVSPQQPFIFRTYEVVGCPDIVAEKRVPAKPFCGSSKAHVWQAARGKDCLSPFFSLKK